MAAIHDLLTQVQDEALRNRLEQEIDRLSKTKKFGLVFEEHLPECTPLYDIKVKRGATVARKNGPVSEMYEVSSIKNDMATCYHKATGTKEVIPLDELVTVAEFGQAIYPYLKQIDSVCNASDCVCWHTLIEADNYHALQLLEYLYPGKVDCIYIDPPYNTGARDWKYNNDYVDSSDSYRHSKWLSFMNRRLKIARKLLNPKDSVLIITIDEKEYLHLGCLLEQEFPEANIQMITDIINPRGTKRENEFSRVDEYIFICRFGEASICKTDNNMLGSTDETGKARVWYPYNRGNNPRSSAPGQFYPIYIDEKEKRIVKVGEPMGKDTPPEDFPQIDGLRAVFPINDKGNQAIWRAVPETTREWVKNGFVKVSTYDKKRDRWTLAYIPSGMRKRIESGEIKVEGRCKDGSLNIQHIDSSLEKVSPVTVWYQKEHNATDYGAQIIKKIIPNHSFSYPKSLYAVEDTLRFFVGDKKEALILDFFAGSGTTMHAVNLLNSEDNGRRRCICVTNNEVSEAEAKSLSEKGFKPGDDEWNKLGVARYVTWPRIVCSTKGIDCDGKKLEGNYLRSNRALADGFKANACFLKLGFLDKTAVALGLQLKELFPLLWMKAGAYGQCPEIDSINLSEMVIFPQNRFAVLIDEKAFRAFNEEIKKHSEIKTLYFVTDSEAGYREMISEYRDKETFQLYRDYLDNFRINTGR